MGKKHNIGNKNPNWKGGKYIDNDGYVRIYSPFHPNKNPNNYVYEHRLIVEKFLGRFLTKEECVHHINEIKNDNRISNLMLFPSNKEHRSFHNKITQFGVTNPIKKQIENRWLEAK